MTTVSQYSWIRGQNDSRAPALLLGHPVPFAIITAIIIMILFFTLFFTWCDLLSLSLFYVF
jgi:hypothetical protein